MTRATAVEFQRKFGEFQHRAQREPVEITRHGRRELVLMSADHYDWLKAAALRTHGTAEAAAVVIEAVERAELGGEHAQLDDELMAKAQATTGLKEKSALVRVALIALIERESARRLSSHLGGTEPDLTASPRRRSVPT